MRSGHSQTTKHTVELCLSSKLANDGAVLLQGKQKVPATPATFVNISAVSANSCIKL